MLLRFCACVALSVALLSGGPAEAQRRAPLVLQSAPERQPSRIAPAPVAEEPVVKDTEDGRAIIPEYLRRSGSRAGGAANDLIGQPSGPPLPGGSIEGAISGRELYHGNYCGYGNRGEGLPPTDDLDAACMRHDACYDRTGRRSCACDRTLEREANVVANSRRYSRALRERAGIVVQAGNVMGCTRP